GPDVFFDASVMVRTGQYNGVPLYSNGTLEPYSVVFVPLERGLMRPYQRRTSPLGQTRAPEPGPPRSAETLAVAPVPVGTTGHGVTPSAPARGVVTLRRPEGNDGLWIAYAGRKWVSAGPAIEIGTVTLRQVGDYAGFPVYTRLDRQDVIYLPT